jgi:hypothetical protein
LELANGECFAVATLHARLPRQRSSWLQASLTYQMSSIGS